MFDGVVGRKLGMTRHFAENGQAVPVTVLEVQQNRVTQIKTPATDGYTAVQVTTGAQKASRLTRPVAGHYQRAGVEAGRGLWEFRVAGETATETQLASERGLDKFEVGAKVDVSAVSKGKGFAGTIKRHNFSGSDRSHGNSKAHRKPGSIGQCQDPGRVFKGKKMAGQLGNTRVTTQNLEVVRVDQDRGVLLLKGAVPGPKGSDVMVAPAVKASKKGG